MQHGSLFCAGNSTACEGRRVATFVLLDMVPVMSRTLTPASATGLQVLDDWVFEISYRGLKIRLGAVRR
jgi:hypothetical protein